MSHKTMIDGVAYEIIGGKTLVNGTAYRIKNGKTLVGGTAYEVGFSKFVLVYDFGSYTPTQSVTSNKTGNTLYYAIITLSELPSGYDKINTLIVDGVEYEITPVNANSTCVAYAYANGDSALTFLTIFDSTASVSLYDNNTHLVQIGYYE